MNLEQTNTIFNILGNFAVAGALIATIINSKRQEIRFQQQLKLQREQWLNDAYIKAEASFWIKFKDELLEFKEVVKSICGMVYFHEGDAYIINKAHPLVLLQNHADKLKKFESLLNANTVYFEGKEEIYSILSCTVSCFSGAVMTFLHLYPDLFLSCFKDHNDDPELNDKYYSYFANGKPLRAKFFSMCISCLSRCDYYKPFFADYFHLAYNEEELEKITNDNSTFNQILISITDKIKEILDITNSTIKYKY